MPLLQLPSHVPDDMYQQHRLYYSTQHYKRNASPIQSQHHGSVIIKSTQATAAAYLCISGFFGLYDHFHEFMYQQRLISRLTIASESTENLHISQTKKGLSAC